MLLEIDSPTRSIIYAPNSNEYHNELINQRVRCINLMEERLAPNEDIIAMASDFTPDGTKIYSTVSKARDIDIDINNNKFPKSQYRLTIFNQSEESLSIFDEEGCIIKIHNFIDRNFKDINGNYLAKQSGHCIVKPRNLIPKIGKSDTKRKWAIHYNHILGQFTSMGQYLDKEYYLVCLYFQRPYDTCEFKKSQKSMFNFSQK